ncbi:ABC transporter ATP-binding protein [bacterium]|nr:ABC transporter ATP-binding protein [Rubripirellula sp.]MDB4338931.1 ABC transporter ATP-binding protein [Rubripirellula sp.]MDC0278627.1 ABC transporter ATP-binding protein [bacterium]MDC0295496.1 ABC transporter ATP-binding protein [bacterium]
MIRLKNLSKLYGKVIGVNDLSIELPSGAFGLVGPNGSGKTTLINLITGQLSPTLGSVQILDADPWKDRKVLRNIGLCPATDVLYPNVTARQWVTYQVRLHGVSTKSSSELAENALEQVGMTLQMDRAMGTYSLGMRQRTKIAQAIAHQPDYLILDEPYNGLDPVGRYQMTELLKHWTAEGKSLLFASHVLHEIEAITSSFLLIHGGRLLASGSAEELDQILTDTPQEVSLIGRDAAGLINHLADKPWVESMRLLENRTELRLSVRDTPALYEALVSVISEGNLSIDQFRSADGKLSAILESLLRQHRGEMK